MCAVRASLRAQRKNHYFSASCCSLIFFKTKIIDGYGSWNFLLTAVDLYMMFLQVVSHSDFKNGGGSPTIRAQRKNHYFSESCCSLSFSRRRWCARDSRPSQAPSVAYEIFQTLCHTPCRLQFCEPIAAALCTY